MMSHAENLKQAGFSFVNDSTFNAPLASASTESKRGLLKNAAIVNSGGKFCYTLPRQPLK